MYLWNTTLVYVRTIYYMLLICSTPTWACTETYTGKKICWHLLIRRANTWMRNSGTSWCPHEVYCPGKPQPDLQCRQKEGHIFINFQDILFSACAAKNSMVGKLGYSAQYLAFLNNRFCMSEISSDRQFPAISKSSYLSNLIQCHR